MRPSLLRNQQGGAVVEMAIGTLIFVPLAFYGIWFADTLHFGIRAQEASMLPAWDVTSALLHDQANGSSPQYGKLETAASTAATTALGDMGTSFDSANPGDTPIAQSVFARASALTVSCIPANSGDGTAPNGSVDWNAAFSDPDTSRLPNNTWLNCTSKLTQKTKGIPTTYAEDFADGIVLFPGTRLTMSMCGIGPGITGCPTATAQGFWLFTDDWGCEDGSSNALQVGAPGGNLAYWTVASEFYHGAGSPGSVTSQIPTGFGDLAPSTDAFRMTYQRGSEGAYDAVENGEGQDHGGAQHSGAASLHTGGPWHDEGYPLNGGQLTFATRQDSHYMAVPAWPAD